MIRDRGFLFFGMLFDGERWRGGSCPVPRRSESIQDIAEFSLNVKVKSGNLTASAKCSKICPTHKKQ
jgi:hypothetical protein